MTKDHNTEQAVSDAMVESALEAFNEFPFRMNGSIARSGNREQMRAAISAALSQVRGKAQEPVAWLIDAADKSNQAAACGYPLATVHKEVVATCVPGIHIITPLVPAAPQVAQEDARWDGPSNLRNASATGGGSE